MSLIFRRPDQNGAVILSVSVGNHQLAQQMFGASRTETPKTKSDTQLVFPTKIKFKKPDKGYKASIGDVIVDTNTGELRLVMIG